MRSRTSYFNKTIYVKNLTHYWPIWTAYLLFCLYQLPLSIYSNLSAEVSGMDSTTYYTQQMVWVILQALSPIPIFIFAAATAAAVFSYLYTARNANMLHALPVCRESLFFSNCLSGLTFLVLPQLISFLAAIFVCFAKGMTHLEYLLYWLFIVVGITIFAFAFAVFTAMITGHIVAVPILYFIFNFLYVGVNIVVNSILCTFTYGLTQVSYSPAGSFLSPLYYLSTIFSWQRFDWNSPTFAELCKENMGCIGLYTLAGLLLFFLALLLYRKRQLETASDVISIPILKPILRWIAAFFGAGIISTFVVGFFLSSTGQIDRKFFPMLIVMLLSGGIIFFLTEMLFCKEIRVFKKKRLAECGIYSAIVLVFFICLGTDVLGIESRIPEEENIASVYFYGGYPVSVQKEDYDDILALHQELIDSRKDYQDYFDRYGGESRNSFVQIRYTLKNGKELNRSYYVPTEDYYLEQEDSAISRLLSFNQLSDYYLRYHFTDNYSSVTFMDGNIDLCSPDGLFESRTLTQSECSQIYDAFRQDVAEGNYDIYDYGLYDMISSKIFYNTLYFSFSAPKGTTFLSYDGEQTVVSSKELQNTAITLTTSCVNTIRTLKEMGIVKYDRTLITQKEYDRKYSVDYEYEFWK